ncbi:hypothetical protein GCM10027053_36050 [Intrasporangium mesophilum]
MVLDFDGVMFDVETAMGLDARDQAVSKLLSARPHRPRPIPITFAWVGFRRTLDYLAEHEPDHAAEAEALISNLELDAALTARPAQHLGELLAVCAATDRKVAVVSDLCENAVAATIGAHTLETHIDAVAARRGLELAAFNAGYTAERAIDLLGEHPSSCLFVSGRWRRLHAAKELGATRLGCECGRDSRKHLATPQIPVVPNLATLTQALLTS